MRIALVPRRASSARSRSVSRARSAGLSLARVTGLSVSITAAVLVAGASAGAYSVARTSAHNVYKDALHLGNFNGHNDNGNSNDGNGNGDNGNDNGKGNDDHDPGNHNGDRDQDPGFPGSPGHHQYAGQCGLPPRRRCIVHIDPQSVHVLEGNSGLTAVTFTITLSGQSDGTVNIGYATQDGTATVADGDYQPANSSVNPVPAPRSRP